MNDGELVPIGDIETHEDKAYAAYKMRLGGENTQVIAKKLGYPNGRRVMQAINNLIDKAIDVASDDRKREIIELELERLDALQSAAWGMAMTGDLKAIDSVLKVMQHRARLLSLGEEKDTATSNTVIISAEDYATTLKEMSK